MQLQQENNVTESDLPRLRNSLSIEISSEKNNFFRNQFAFSMFPFCDRINVSQGGDDHADEWRIPFQYH